MRRFVAIVGFVSMVGGLAGTASAASIGLVGDDACLAGPKGVLFCDNDVRSTGTGVLDPFLRTNPGSKDPSSGWNTDAHKNTWTTINDADDAWTSALAKSGLGTVTLNGTSYYEFTVDINQVGQPGDPSSLLSLSHFELFDCTTSTNTSVRAGSGCTSIFNIFDGAVTDGANGRPSISDTSWVDFNYRNHTGSGEGDIKVLIPLSALAGVLSTHFISLLDGWGTPGGFMDNDGFQEWRARLGTATCPDGTTPGTNGECDVTVPEPASLLLFGLAAFGSAYGVRRRRVVA